VALLEEAGFVDVEVGPSFDTFEGAKGEEKARTFGTSAYAFVARKP